MKIAINKKHGGFGLSDAAYEKLIEWGVPVKEYVEEKPDPKTGLYVNEPSNEGEVIFDRSLSGENPLRSFGRYWDTWTRDSRTHPLVIKVIEELGKKANGPFAKLKVVEIPDGTEFTIEEYDGLEWIAEAHKTWS